MEYLTKLILSPIPPRATEESVKQAFEIFGKPILTELIPKTDKAIAYYEKGNVEKEDKKITKISIKNNELNRTWPIKLDWFNITPSKMVKLNTEKNLHKKVEDHSEKISQDHIIVEEEKQQ